MIIDNPDTTEVSTQQTRQNNVIAADNRVHHHTEAQGAAALALIQAIPQASSRLGSHINLHA